MFTIQIYFILNLFLVFLALIFFIFKKIEYKGRKLKYFFIILVNISLLEFFLNLDIYYPSDVSKPLNLNFLHAPLLLWIKEYF